MNGRLSVFRLKGTKIKNAAEAVLVNSFGIATDTEL